MWWFFVHAALAQDQMVSTLVVVADVNDPSVVDDLVTMVESHPDSVGMLVQAMLVDRRIDVCLADRFYYSSAQPAELVGGKRIPAVQGANWTDWDLVHTRVHLEVAEPTSELSITAEVFASCTHKNISVTLKGAEPALLVGDEAVVLMVSRVWPVTVPGRTQLGQLSELSEFADLSMGWSLRETKQAVHTLLSTLEP
jgi:hypothetical protein